MAAVHGGSGEDVAVEIHLCLVWGFGSEVGRVFGEVRIVL